MSWEIIRKPRFSKLKINSVCDVICWLDQPVFEALQLFQAFQIGDTRDGSSNVLSHDSRLLRSAEASSSRLASQDFLTAKRTSTHLWQFGIPKNLRTWNIESKKQSPLSMAPPNINPSGRSLRSDKALSSIEQVFAPAGCSGGCINYRRKQCTTWSVQV